MYKSIATLFALAAVAVRAAPAPSNTSEPLGAEELAKRDSSSGQATYFEVGLGACGWWNGNQDMIVAMNSAQFNGGGPCGQWITIQNNENGQTVAAYVADECPSCDWGSLDMSPQVFGQLNNWNYDEGVFPITWWYNN